MLRVARFARVILIPYVAGLPTSISSPGGSTISNGTFVGSSSISWIGADTDSNLALEHRFLLACSLQLQQPTARA